MIFIIAQEQGTGVSSLKDIAEAINSPVAFTSKILQNLVKHKLVQSSKGKGGGFSVSKQIGDNLTLWDIINATEGDSLENRCFLGLDKCSNQNPCAAHFEYLKVKSELLHFLKASKIENLSAQVLKGQGILKF